MTTRPLLRRDALIAELADALPRDAFDDYQTHALATYKVPSKGDPLALAALGLAGEAGEVVELVKKHLFHGAPLAREKLLKEAGDVLWYLALLARLCDTNLSVVAQANIAKLQARFPDGWSPEAQRAKRDVPSWPECDTCSKLADFRVIAQDGEGGLCCESCYASYPQAGSWQKLPIEVLSDLSDAAR